MVNSRRYHASMTAVGPRRDHVRRLYDRYGRLFWILHSLWALATGAVVLLLARRHWALLPWVGVFLGLTWCSTLFFSRISGRLPETPKLRLSRGVVSYLTRVMYQETLFFLIPFYWYSTTVDSPNVLFLGFLVVLAVLSCLDLVFDRLLRLHPAVALAYFAMVAFATLDFLLPLVFGLQLRWVTPAAAGLAFATALPLAYSPRQILSWPRVLRIAAVGVTVLAASILLRVLVPPAPLRVDHARFGASFVPAPPQMSRVLDDPSPATRAGRELVVVVEIFSPTRLPTRISLRWYRDGALVHTSRDVTILAHELGFRVWDAYKPAEGGIRPGAYRVDAVTVDDQLIGRARLTLTPTSSAR